MSKALFRPRLLDDILSVQAKHVEQSPLLAYPRDGTIADFELFTARDLDLMVDRSAKHYSKLHIEPQQEPILALIGPSNPDYLITQFALSRLGFGILLLSTRLAPEACLKLMRENSCRTVFQSESTLSYALGHKAHDLDNDIRVIPMADRIIYGATEIDPEPLVRLHDPDQTGLEQKTAIVYHSSGSTGLPKSIGTSHATVLSPIPPGKGSKFFMTSPLVHAYASKLTINAMMAGKCMYLASATVPQTSANLTEALRAANPDSFLTVPYVLKLLAETEAGIDILRKCGQVVSSGSTLPDELGDRLCRAGVNLGMLFAGTEPGLVGTSMNRPPGDTTWDYIRLVPAVQKNIIYKRVSDEAVEFVFLKDLPTLVMSNSNDPPGSFHSSDIFKAHPTIPNAWKYVGRIDDRVTLSTGEKVLPLPMEGRIRQDALVREAVVFGIGRAIPGLLIFRADAAKDMSDEQFLDAIWPTVEAVNVVTEGFARVGKDMIVCMPAGVHVPIADKESIIRAKVYKSYEVEINVAYARLENGSTGGLILKLDELENFLLKLVKEEVRLPIKDASTDFHQAGMDSLGAIRLRGLIMRNLSVGRQLSENVVFEAGNTYRLARLILSSQSPDNVPELTAENEITLMEKLIAENSLFSSTTWSTENAYTGANVLLTGATGSLGAHLLAQLSQLPSVSNIYCIARGNQPSTRIEQALMDRDLDLSALHGKVKYYAGDLGLPNLGLQEHALDELRRNVTHIVHAAWPVNFQLGLASFKPQLDTLHDLLQLAISVKDSTPARLQFCSSISAAMATPTPAIIKETPIMDLTHASSTGYARSKLVGEHITVNAVKRAGASAQILRIGQIVGDTVTGSWNDSEAWPLIIRSALTLKTLPALDMECSWLPVDTLARSMIELLLPPADTASDHLVLNLENPKTFHWTRDLLPALKQGELNFETVAPSAWLQQLQEYHDKDPSEIASKANPAIKLLGYFQQLVQSTLEYDQAGHTNTERPPQVVFDTTLAQACSSSLRSAPDVIADGLVEKFLTKWMQQWQ